MQSIFKIMSCRIYIIALTCNVISFISGVSLTWSSPVIYKLEHNLDDNPLGRYITKDEGSWVVSIASIGSMFGPFIFAMISEKFGRKIAMCVACILPIICYAILAFAETIILYYVARALAGLAVGGSFAVVPLYICEISSDSNRGTLGGLFNCFIAAGTFFAYCVGPYTSIMVFHLILLVFPIAAVILMLFIMPESPHFYLINKNKEKAITVLQQLRGIEDVSSEIEQIESALNTSEVGSLKSIFKSRGLQKGFIIGFALVIFQQFTGILAIMSYAQEIFHASGSTLESAVCSIILGLVQFLASFITPILADRLPRKALFLISSIGMVIAEVPLGVYFYLKDDGQNVDEISWLPLATLMLYIIVYNIGFGSLPLPYVGEILPPHVKDNAMSCICVFGSVMTFVVSKFFPNLEEGIGMGPSFLLFSGFSVLSTFFIIYYMVETRGKSLEEIQDILNK